MFWKLLVGWCLMSLCVAIHAWGVTVALRWLRPATALPQGFWQLNWLFARFAGWIILMHLAEIAAWAMLYVIGGAMPELQTAFYFSSVTYTTTGYGDFVLPTQWRLVGGIEALTGILMCGWSTGFFFAVVGRVYERQSG